MRVWCPWGGHAVVNPQLSAVQLLALQEIHRLHGAIDINEICVCKTTGLASAAIDGYSDVDDVAYFAEEIAEVLVRHLEGHVTDEEGLGGRVHATRLTAVDGLAWAVELDSEAAALKDLLVGSLDSLGGIVDIVELDVTESVVKLTRNEWLEQS